MGAGGALGAGAAGAGAAGSAAGGAGALGGAFGSADMLAAANVANNIPLAATAAESALPALVGTEAPIPYNSSMATFGPNNEFVGAGIENAGLTPNSFTGGYDSVGTLGRFGQRLSSGMDQLSGNINPMKMMNMGQPQQTQQVSRPPAIQRPQSQPATEAALPYGQGLLDTRNNMSEDELKQRLMLAQMRGLLNG